MDESGPKKHRQIYPHNTVLSEYKEPPPHIARSHNKTRSHIENLHWLEENVKKLRLVLHGNNNLTKFGHEGLKAITNYMYIKGKCEFDVATGVVSYVSCF